MKILILAPQPFYQHRGTPIAVKLLAEVMGRNNHEIHLLVFHEGENLDMDNVTLHRIPSLPGLKDIPPGFSFRKIICDLLLWFKSIKLQRRIQFDFVHAVEEGVFLARINKVFFQVPYVYDMDSCMSDQLVAKAGWLKPLRRCFEWMENSAIRGSAGVIAVCRALEEKVREEVPGKLLVRLEDISLLQESPGSGEPVESLRESYGIRGKIILYIGNLESYQGIDLLLDGFALLSTRRKDCTLVIIGGSENDIAKYSNKCREMGLAERVFLIGPRPVQLLGQYLEQADVLVSPRIEGENTPMKIYSYLDSGRPVLATRIVSHTQVLDESIAFLVKPDSQNLALGLEQLLADDALGARLAGAAKKRVAEKYSLPVFVEKLTGYYQQLAERFLQNAH